MTLVAEATQAFARSLDVDETLRNTIARFSEYLHAEAGAVFLVDGGRLVCASCVGPVDITGQSLPLHSGIAGRVLDRRRPEIVHDVRREPAFEASLDRRTGFVTRSLICVPLVVHDEAIGVLELVNRREGSGRFRERDLHLARVLASAAALAIHNARMVASLLEKERIERELHMARSIQQALLPAEPGAGGGLAGCNVPATEVSGDFFDYVPLSDGRWFFSLGDVSGKGTNAALLMAIVSSLLRCLAREGLSPAPLLAHVNREFMETAVRGMFVTVVAGVYDPGTARVRIANAGHLPALVVRNDGRIEEIPASGPPVGVLERVAYEEVEIDLDGGVLYLFTDGIVEGGAALGVAGLRARLARAHRDGGHPEDPCRLVELGAGGRKDDRTVLVIDPRRARAGVAGGRLLESRIRASPDALRQMRRQLRGTLAALGLSTMTVDRLVLAVDEALSNVVRHAYGAPDRGDLVLRVELQDGWLRFVVEDEAPPVDPERIRPRAGDPLEPGGLGLQCIERIMDRVRFTHREGGRGNRFVMEKRIMGGERGLPAT